MRYHLPIDLTERNARYAAYVAEVAARNLEAQNIGVAKAMAKAEAERPTPHNAGDDQVYAVTFVTTPPFGTYLPSGRAGANGGAAHHLVWAVGKAGLARVVDSVGANLTGIGVGRYSNVMNGRHALPGPIKSNPPRQMTRPE